MGKGLLAGSKALKIQDEKASKLLLQSWGKWFITAVSDLGSLVATFRGLSFGSTVFDSKFFVSHPLNVRSWLDGSGVCESCLQRA